MVDMNERTFQVSNAQRLEDPERKKFLPPLEVVHALDLQPGMAIADIGAGTGYFALPIASAVSSEGRVYAVDFQTGMLDLLGQKLLESGAPPNVSLIHGSASHTTLPPTCVDFVFMANIWHEVDEHALILKETARILRHPGRLAVLDWRPDCAPPPGPPADHRVSGARVAETLEANGWRPERSGHVGKYSYLILAVRV
jgi:ubiquinone/menaquinone biosynthesis C-methylase UbiE